MTDAQTAPSLDADLGAITCGTDTNGSFTLAPGATASCTATYTVSQADRDAGTISDLGTVTGTPPSGPNVSATSPATVAVTQAPAITITKTAAPTTVTPTDTTVTYTFAVENTGNVTLTQRRRDRRPDRAVSGRGPGRDHLWGRHQRLVHLGPGRHGELHGHLYGEPGRPRRRHHL